MVEFLNKRFSIIVVILSIATSFIAAAHWFSDDKILYFWDAYIPFDPRISFEQIFYYWQDRIFPGFPTPGLSWLIYWGLFFLPYKIFHSLSVSQAFVYMFLLSFSVINFFFLAKHILKSIFKDKNELVINLTSLAVGILYTYNIFTFFNFYFMFNPGAFVIAFLPLNFLALFKIYPLAGEIDTRRNNYWILIFIVSLLFMSPGFGVYVFYLQYLIWLGIYIFLYLLVSKKGLLSKLTVELVVFYTFVFFLNLWWFFPALLNLVGSYSTQSQFGTTVWFDEGFKDVQLLNVLRGIGSALMTNNKFSWTDIYSQNFFTIPLFLLPALFVSALMFLKRKITILLTFLLGVTLVSLFIVKFSNPPFAWILGYLFHYVPFFGGFRDSVQKAGVYFQLGYMIFIAMGASLVLDFILEKRSRLIMTLFLSVFLVSSVILTGPFFLFSKDNIRTEKFVHNGKEYLVNAKTKIPPEYLSLKSFLQDRCQGETVIEIPRSGFVTNAIWEKYGLSYAGQDILPAMIDCNFLSTATFNGRAESSIQTPYLFLQDGDIFSFKSYLRQQKIRYILTREDFVPQNLVTWTYVEPLDIKNKLLGDEDFRQIYSNDFLTVIEYREVDPGQYGFGLSENPVYIPSGIKDGHDSKAALQIIGSLESPVFLDTKQSQDLFKEKAEVSVISANCIGCVKINPKAVIKIHSSKTQTLKNYVKSVLKKQTNYTKEVQISIRILSVNDKFLRLMKAIEEEDENRMMRLSSEYENGWKEIDSSIFVYDADWFQKNNKYIEATNFLTIQKNTLFNELSAHAFNPKKFLTTSGNREKIESLIFYQNNLLKKLSVNIDQTSFKDNEYVSRLDVPRNDSYRCMALQVHPGADIRSVSIGDTDLLEENFTGERGMSLTEGSHLLRIKYNLFELLRLDSTTLKTQNHYPISLGEYKQGKYSFSFMIPPGYGGRLSVAITRGEISKDTLDKLDLVAMGPETRYVDAFDVSDFRETPYSSTFEVDSSQEGDYYLYLYLVNPSIDEFEVRDIEVETFIQNNHFRFTCATQTVSSEMKNEGLSIEKISPTHYMVNLPRSYSGFLTFNQAFDNNWVAYAEGSSGVLPHIKNGYANAWYLENQPPGKILIKHISQKKTENAIFISLIASIILFLVYTRLKKQ